MLMHCFWLLESKFAFEFKCLILSLNLSKFRSLEKAPDLLLLKAQPSPAIAVWLPKSAGGPRTSGLVRFVTLSAQQRPSFSPPTPRRPAQRLSSLAVADRWGPPVIPHL